ncbi:hypothetical protein FKN11_24435 [Vibrio sp. 2-2(7)]|uniref:hypothetical protein n=1 Tax=Vibrio sp. 2-2(7) TaxID=2591013 RepID=UPI0014833161|nr:hypothetical protein [Vibrio sp. 2-2(7)]NNN54569.1 hypothetical protein [Vibrio sp. 2-2(7)]
MGIKNWTITAEGTKSAAARERYLNDKTHKNHKHTEGYLDVHGGLGTTLNMIRNTERHKLETARNKKGGRPPLEATEFVLTFPKGIRPTKEQWKNMLAKVMLDIADNIGVNREELAPICRAVAHQQDQSPERKGSGDHLHVIVGRFTNDGKYLRALQSKSTLHRMKQSFNVAALEVMRVNHATYEPVKKYEGTAKKRAPQWKIKAARAYEEIEARAQNLERSEDEKRDLLRVMNKLYLQSEKLVEAHEQGDKKQLNRQANRVSKSLEELEEFKLKGEEFTDEVQELNKSLEEASKRLRKPLRVKPLAP